MTEARRQLWIGYGQSMGIAVVLSAALTPVIPLPASGNRLVIAAASAFIFGTGFFLLSLIKEGVRMRTFSANILVQTVLTFATIVVCFAGMVYAVAVAMNPGHALDPELPSQLADILPARVWLGYSGLALLVSGGINAFFQVNRKLGPGVLWHWVTGKYYNPREEERIFMFLDMKDSTTLAEQLGPIKFSALVRDFFRDLTFPVLESKAQVSHYIGDEAVISWRPKAGFADANCVQLFFRMQRALQARADYYRTNYGFIPDFKAGIHVGPVVATEVGELKSEIVFHGDTLNTTARIQGLCNELGPLLLSATVAEGLTLPKGMRSVDVGMHQLKGKAEQTALFSVEAAESGSPARGGT